MRIPSHHTGTPFPVNYTEFLARKQDRVIKPGRQIQNRSVHRMLHPWQRQIVRWAVHTSRAAIWADTGLGKTMMQLEWARLSGDTALIIAPLAVCEQTSREAAKLGIAAPYVQYGDQVAGPGVWITNYERIQHFPPNMFDAVVLDESSILKQSNGKTRMALTDWVHDVPHRLACSATPAPNDPEELTTQAEWLGQSTRVNMLATYFIHDQDGWRLKGHAVQAMYRWLANWAIAIRTPSDIGGDDTGYILPGLAIHPEIVKLRTRGDIGGITGRTKMRQHTLTGRVWRAADLVADHPGPWILWCGLNNEADMLAREVPGSVNVHGGLSAEDKATLLRDFADGAFDVLITKPSIASQGLNYQHCHRMAFVGLGDSYEQYYQAIRRCYRYGQQHVVHAHVIVSEPEAAIVRNVIRKEKQAKAINEQLIAEMRKTWKA